MAATVFECRGGCAIFPSTPFGSSSGACSFCAAVSKRRCTVSTSAGRLLAFFSHRPTEPLITAEGVPESVAEIPALFLAKPQKQVSLRLMLPVFLHAPSVVSKSVSVSLISFVFLFSNRLTVLSDVLTEVFSLPYISVRWLRLL